MAKLTDKERKMILAELTMGSSIRACASKYHTSVGTVQRIKHESSDEIRQQIEKKNAENTKDVLAFMEMQKGSACNLIAKSIPPSAHNYCSVFLLCQLYADFAKQIALYYCARFG